MHNLRTERFFNAITVNGRTVSADGPIKTFPLRGIKDSPPYLHDDRRSHSMTRSSSSTWCSG